MREATERELIAFEVEAKALDSPFMATNFHLGYSVGLGILALPIVAPSVWKLPYDVMTVPLSESLG